MSKTIVQQPMTCHEKLTSAVDMVTTRSYVSDSRNERLRLT